MVRTFSEIIEKVKNNNKKQRVGIVGAEKKVSIETAKDLVENNMAIPVLFGDLNKIKNIIKDMNIESNFEIIDCEDDEKSSHKAVDFATDRFDSQGKRSNIDSFKGRFKKKQWS